MGLDMYLTGEKYIPSNHREPEKNIKEDGFRLQRKHLELGYWRKHPDLHGYIVQTFADGVDECQEIELSKDDLQNIINSIRASNLPHTEGFFFGKSSGHTQEEDIEILQKALEWLNKESKDWKTVCYQASW